MGPKLKNSFKSPPTRSKSLMFKDKGQIKENVRNYESFKEIELSQSANKSGLNLNTTVDMYQGPGTINMSQLNLNDLKNEGQSTPNAEKSNLQSSERARLAMEGKKDEPKEKKEVTIKNRLLLFPKCRTRGCVKANQN